MRPALAGDGLGTLSFSVLQGPWEGHRDLPAEQGKRVCPQQADSPANSNSKEEAAGWQDGAEIGRLPLESLLSHSSLVSVGKSPYRSEI